MNLFRHLITWVDVFDLRDLYLILKGFKFIDWLNIGFSILNFLACLFVNTAICVDLVSLVENRKVFVNHGDLEQRSLSVWDIQVPSLILSWLLVLKPLSRGL